MQWVLKKKKGCSGKDLQKRKVLSFVHSWLLYTTQHRAELPISFPLRPQTIIIARMLSSGRVGRNETRYRSARWSIALAHARTQARTHAAAAVRTSTQRPVTAETDRCADHATHAAREERSTELWMHRMSVRPCVSARPARLRHDISP